MASFGFLCTSLWVAGKVTMIGDPLSVSDRWLEENFGANNAAWKDVFAMFFHSRCGFLTAWIPLKRFTLADWRLAWCFQFLVESGCGFGHFRNSFGEFVFLEVGNQCLWTTIFTTVVLLQSVPVYFTTVFFVYLQLVCIYLQMSVFFHIYLMMACGKWFSFKRGCGNFHLSQMSFYCDENICGFLVTFTSQRYSLWGVYGWWLVRNIFTEFGMVSLCMDGERPILHVSAKISSLWDVFMIWIYG